MLEQLELSSLVPGLAVAGLGAAFPAFGEVAIATWQGSLPRPPIFVAVCNWISYASAFAICSIITDAYSHKLVSQGVQGLVICLIVAAMAGARAALIPRRNGNTAGARGDH